LTPGNREIVKNFINEIIAAPKSHQKDWGE